MKRSATHDDESAYKNRSQPSSTVQITRPLNQQQPRDNSLIHHRSHGSASEQQQPRGMDNYYTDRQRNPLNNELLTSHQAPTRPPPYSRVYRDKHRTVSAVQGENDCRDVAVRGQQELGQQNIGPVGDVEQGLVVCGLSVNSIGEEYVEELGDFAEDGEEYEEGEDDELDSTLDRRRRRRSAKPMYRKILNYIRRRAWSKGSSSSTGKPIILINLLLGKSMRKKG